MIKNYIKTAWRNLLRNKTYSLINVLSITIGIAAFWMIALYVADEFSFDRNIPNADRIYRIAQHASWDGGKLDLPLTSPPLSPAMKAAFPEIGRMIASGAISAGTPMASRAGRIRSIK